MNHYLFRMFVRVTDNTVPGLSVPDQAKYDNAGVLSGDLTFGVTPCHKGSVRLSWVTNSGAECGPEFDERRDCPDGDTLLPFWDIVDGPSVDCPDCLKHRPAVEEFVELMRPK